MLLYSVLKANKSITGFKEICLAFPKNALLLNSVPNLNLGFSAKNLT